MNFSADLKAGWNIHIRWALSYSISFFFILYSETSTHVCVWWNQHVWMGLKRVRGSLRGYLGSFPALAWLLRCLTITIKFCLYSCRQRSAFDKFPRHQFKVSVYLTSTRPTASLTWPVNHIQGGHAAYVGTMIIARGYHSIAELLMVERISLLQGG